MEKKSDFFMLPNSGFRPFIRRWEPRETQLKGNILIIHGVSEHSGRYAPFAEALNQAGYAVYAYDQRGHGQSIAKPEDEGYAGKDGWNHLVSDVFDMVSDIKMEASDLPVYIFGHSMGSFILQGYMHKYQDKQGIAGFILSGPTGAATSRLVFGRLLSHLLTVINSKYTKSKLLQDLIYKDFNARCTESRTEYDWLTRDRASVDRYIQDEHCGNPCTAGFYHEFFGGIMAFQKQSNIEKIPKNIPVLIFSGRMDPVGQYGKVAESIQQRYRSAGIKDVTLHLYEDGRHEMLNELNREEVVTDIVQWLDSKI